MKAFPRLRPCPRLTALVLAGSIAALLSTHPARAASQNWTGGSVANGNWSTVLNWNGAVPGSTSLTASTDLATFNAAIANWWGSSASIPIVIDLNRNLGGINFDLASGAYFIGSASGNPLKVSSGGTIQILSTLTATNRTVTINAPLQIQGPGGTYTLANNSANGTGAGAGTLNIGGGITGGAAGATVLTLAGSNTNANTLSGVIANGSATTLGVTKTGAGTWYLTGANTYSGPTTINQGTLRAYSSAALGDGSATNTLLFNGGTLQAGNSFTSPATRGVTLQAGGGTADTNGLAVTMAGVITGAGGLTKTSTGTLTLTGTNDYTGATTISGGTLSVATIGDGGVAGNLGKASNAAANLVFSGGTLRYTGATAGTDRNFTLANLGGTIEVTDSAANLTCTGASAATFGSFIKTGAGTLTFAGSNGHTASTQVNVGTLVLDFTATNTSKLSDSSSLTLRSATLQLDRATGASGSHIEIVSSTLLSGGASITRGAGSTAVLRMNAITRNAGSTVNFGAASSADTDTLNAANGLLGTAVSSAGTGWATIGGTDFAMNSTNGADGLVTAYSSYTPVTRQSSGTKAIASVSTSNVRGSSRAPAVRPPASPWAPPPPRSIR